MYDPFVAAVDKGRIRTTPSRSMPAAPLPTPGAILLGDALNMRHPLTGGGMTVALSDVALFISLIRAEGIRQMFFPASIPTYYRASHKPKMHECHLST